jgi:hypothetical protein
MSAPRSMIIISLPSLTSVGEGFVFFGRSPLAKNPSDGVIFFAKVGEDPMDPRRGYAIFFSSKTPDL